MSDATEKKCDHCGTGFDHWTDEHDNTDALALSIRKKNAEISRLRAALGEREKVVEAAGRLLLLPTPSSIPASSS